MLTYSFKNIAQKEKDISCQSIFVSCKGSEFLPSQSNAWKTKENYCFTWENFLVTNNFYFFKFSRVITS